MANSKPKVAEKPAEEAKPKAEKAAATQIEQPKKQDDIAQKVADTVAVERPEPATLIDNTDVTPVKVKPPKESKQDLGNGMVLVTRK